MLSSYLYSVILELCAVNMTAIPAHRGDHTHALFLDLVRQIDPELSNRLHDEQDYRPFTVSVLLGANVRDGMQLLQAGQVYRMHLTLLDGGRLWQCLSTHFLETSSLMLRLDTAQLQLARVLATPASDSTGWAGYTDWQTLSEQPAYSSLTLHFASPCAFSIGDRRFALFPEPPLVWGSLLRTWNRHAPPVLHIDKVAFREFVAQQVVVSEYDLSTAKVPFHNFAQKGFQGTCTYQIKSEEEYARQLVALAAFARYAGIGSKTTMGMGQARLEETETFPTKKYSR